MTRVRIEPKTIIIALALGALLYLVLGPLAMLIFSSFRLTEGLLPFSPGVPWTLANYAQVLFSETTWRVLGNTLIVSVGALTFSFAISITLAWLTERSDMPLRNVLFIAIVASIGVPHIILGIAWELVLNPVNGLVNLMLQDLLGLDPPGPLNIFTLPGLVFVQGLSLVPVTYLLLLAAFRSMDVALEEAGSTAGGNYRRVFTRITLPLLTPALLSTLVYQFVTVIESFDIPLIIGLRAGIPVLSTQVFVTARPPVGIPDYGLASTYSVFLLLLSVAPMIIYNRVLGQADRYATITGRGHRARRISLGAWKVPALLLALSFIFLKFLLPVAVLIWTSLLPFYLPPSAEAFRAISLDAYLELFDRPTFQLAIRNTVILGLCTPLFTLTIATVVSWIIVRTRTRMRFLVDLLAFAPHAMPGVIIGLSILLIYLLLPLPIVDTVWVILIAVGTQSISLATRLMSSAIAQINRELEEASDMSGASWWTSMRRVVFPLVLPAILNGYVIVFLSAIRNLTLALILLSPGNIVLSTLVYDFWRHAETGSAAAVGVVMVALTVVVSVALRFRRFQGRVGMPLQA